ncbi:MAG: invasin domain 3-containing protein [Armatimonadota bacterium]
MADGRFAIGIDAIPASIAADGKSFSQIALTIRNADGTIVPDGTEIRLVTTSGVITTAAYTSNGRATAILTSSSSPGIAVVTASIGEDSASIQVEFSADIEQGRTTSRVLRMNGGTLAYSIEQDMILASDDVTVDYRGLSINASNIQFSEPSGVIKAQGNVIISRGDIRFRADAFIYDLRSDRCRMMTADTPVSINLFRADDIKPSAWTKGTPSMAVEFVPLEAEGTKTWIVSRKLTMFPNEKIQFFRASVYLGDIQIMNMPYYFFDYANRGALFNQIRYTTYDGLVVDYPVYYNVTDHNTGALKLRYSGSKYGYGSYLYPRKGFSLAIDQSYTLGENGDGRVFIDSFTSDKRSLELTHHQDFGNLRHPGRADFSVRFQPNSDFGKKAYTANLNIFGDKPGYGYFISGYIGGSEYQRFNILNPEEIEYQKQTSGSIRLSINPKKTYIMGSTLSASPVLSTNYGNPGFARDRSKGACLYQTAGLNFHTKPFGGKSLSFSIDGATEALISNDGRSGTGLRTGITSRKSWGGANVSLNYTLALISGSISTMYYPSKHNLGGTLSLGHGRKWNGYTYFGYGLDTGRMNIYSSINYQITDKWKLRGNYNFYRYKYTSGGVSISSDTSYLKAGIYRPFGPYEVGIAWSPDGELYGLKDSKRIWLEVGLPGFF